MNHEYMLNIFKENTMSWNIHPAYFSGYGPGPALQKL